MKDLTPRMEVFPQLSASDHELVLFCNDSVTNLFATCDRDRVLPQQAAMGLAKKRLREAANPRSLAQADSQS